MFGLKNYLGRNPALTTYLVLGGILGGLTCPVIHSEELHTHIDSETKFDSTCISPKETLTVKLVSKNNVVTNSNDDVRWGYIENHSPKPGVTITTKNTFGVKG